MTDGAWRYAFTSVSGTSHLRGALPCQDASGCQLVEGRTGQRILIAVVADGAGSAAQSAVGAQLACRLFHDALAAFFAEGGEITAITREFVTAWLAQFHDAVEATAAAHNSQVRDFACTFIAAIIGAQEAAFVQIGDGAIVVAAPADPERYSWIFWPQRGEYENVTVFATDPRAHDYLALEVVRREFDDLALFTDGLQRLALHFASQTVHDPFFRPLFQPLRAAPAGYLAGLSTALANFLNSPAVNERTDDDKTLVLATRRVTTPPVTPPPPPSTRATILEPAEQEPHAGDGA